MKLLKNKKTILLALVVTLAALAMTGCMANAGAPPEKAAGFFAGIWHGWIAPFALIMSIFNDGVAIYEVHNTGFWYDFAYYGAIVGGAGSLTYSRGSARRKRNKD